MAEFETTQEIVSAAYANLSQSAFDYIAGGAESETTMRQNRAAFDRWSFRPRVLRDVSKLDTSAVVLGEHLRIPVMLAPIGSLQLFEPGGAATVGKAAAQFGTMQVVSSQTQPALEETAQGSDGPKIFQLYVLGDLDWCREIIGRAKASGYRALVITVDMAVYGRRERALISHWSPPTRRRGAANQVFLSELTWDKIEAIREIWGDGPFGVKGISTAEDAQDAVARGMDIIWVSNHGGRQLDHAIASLDALPEVVKDVGARATVLLDGGVQRGTDVLKAIALGAHAVGIGKLCGWGLAAGGQRGVERVLEIVEEEIQVAMALLGVTALDQLGPQYLCRTAPVTNPHEMSSWVNIPEGRIS